TGSIVYRTSAPDIGKRQFEWVDRSGRELDKVIYPDTAAQSPSLSRDGRRIMLNRYVDGNMDIWSYETGHHRWNRETFDSGDDIFPLWSPDAGRVVFGSNRLNGVMNLYLKLLSAPQGSEELLPTPGTGPRFPMDWSPDGQYLLYDIVDPQKGGD